MKKILSVFFTLVLAFSFVGCGSSEEKEEAYRLEIMDYCIEVMGEVNQIAEYAQVAGSMNLSPTQRNNMLRNVANVLDKTNNFGDLDVPPRYKDAHFEMEGRMYLISMTATDMMDAYDTNNVSLYNKALDDAVLNYDYVGEFFDAIGE